MSTIDPSSTNYKYEDVEKIIKNNALNIRQDQAKIKKLTADQRTLLTKVFEGKIKDPDTATRLKLNNLRIRLEHLDTSPHLVKRKSNLFTFFSRAYKNKWKDRISSQEMMGRLDAYNAKNIKEDPKSKKKDQSSSSSEDPSTSSSDHKPDLPPIAINPAKDKTEIENDAQLAAKMQDELDHAEAERIAKKAQEEEDAAFARQVNGDQPRPIDPFDYEASDASEIQRAIDISLNAPPTQETEDEIARRNRQAALAEQQALIRKVQNNEYTGNIPEKWNDSEDVVQAFITRDPNQIQYASETLQKATGFLMGIAEVNGNADFLPYLLENNKISEEDARDIRKTLADTEDTTSSDSETTLSASTSDKTSESEEKSDPNTIKFIFELPQIPSIDSSGAITDQNANFKQIEAHDARVMNQKALLKELNKKPKDLKSINTMYENKLPNYSEIIKAYCLFAASQEEASLPTFSTLSLETQQDKQILILYFKAGMLHKDQDLKLFEQGAKLSFLEELSEAKKFKSEKHSIQFKDDFLRNNPDVVRAVIKMEPKELLFSDLAKDLDFVKTLIDQVGVTILNLFPRPKNLQTDEGKFWKELKTYADAKLRSL